MLKFSIKPKLRLTLVLNGVLDLSFKPKSNNMIDKSAFGLKPNCSLNFGLNSL